MINTLKILSRCLLAALVLFFTISSRSMAVASTLPSNAIYSTNTSHSATLPFLNYTSRRYAANRLVETPDPSSVDVHPVLSMTVPVQTGMGLTSPAATSGSFVSSRLLPLRI